MATTVTESMLVRRPLEVVAPVATDPDVVLPIMGGLGRFRFIETRDDDTELWDVFLDIGAIHVGGRVVVDAPSADRLAWHAVRGTRHQIELRVEPRGEHTLVSISLSLELAGSVLAKAAELLARGIARRHLEAGLQQLRHHLEFEM